MSSSLLADHLVDEASAGELLAAARERRATADRAEAELLVIAVQWADLHPPETVDDAACFIAGGSEHVEPIAGEGCPLVAEFCLAEFGSVLGTSTIAAKRLVGQALELRHRLPRLWGRVQAGEVPAWRARRIAETTIHACPMLTRQAARWVDDQIAPFAERTGVAQIDRTVQEAIKRAGPPILPEDPEDPNPLRPDSRNVVVDQQQVTWSGTLRLSGEIDLADGLDLEHALATGAAELKALGSVATLGARRAQALGHLARHQLALDLAGAGPIGDHAPPFAAHPGAAEARSHQAPSHQAPTHQAQTPEAPATLAGSALLPPARELVLHVHLSALARAESDPADPIRIDGLGRLEEGQQLVLLEQVRSWCADSHTRVTLKPVIDLNDQIETCGYAPTTRQREHVQLRDRTCLFPWCSRPARRCDVDHVVPFDHDAQRQGRPQPGPTNTANLIALCRRHHRLKTHGRWSVRAPAPGLVVWTSPHGYQFCSDASGTGSLAVPTRTRQHRRR